MQINQGSLSCCLFSSRSYLNDVLAATDPIIPFTNVDASPGIQIIDKLRCTDGEWGCDSPVYYYFDKKPVDRSYIGSDEAGRLGIHSGLSKEAHLRRQIVLAGLIPTTELIAKVKLVIDEPEFATNFAYLEDDYLADGYDENDPDTWGIVLKPNHAENASGLSCLDLMDGGANCECLSSLCDSPLMRM